VCRPARRTGGWRQGAVTRRPGWIVPALLAAVVAASPPALAAPDTASLEQRLDEGFAHVRAWRFADAAAVFDECLARAQAEGSVLAEARARLGRGQVRTGTERLAEAPVELREALRLFQAADHPHGVGRTLTALGIVAQWQGEREAARDLYKQALAALEHADDPSEAASVLRNLSMLSVAPESLALIRQAWETVHPVGNPRIEGRVLHHWGDILGGRGDYRGALEKLEAAVALLEAADDRSSLARALTSLGVHHRRHGRHEEALALYKRALALQESIGDRKGIAQSLGAIGAALRHLQRYREAVPHHERALGLARETGLAAGGHQPLGRFLSGLAGAYVAAGEPARAMPVLEEALRSGGQAPGIGPGIHSTHALALLQMGREDEALAATVEAVRLARAGGAPSPDILVPALAVHAGILERLGRTGDALQAAEEALQVLERLRTTLRPDDFDKRGFADHHQGLYARVVTLLDRLDRPGEALESAEKARGRAFLDLLAAASATAPPALGDGEAPAGVPSLVASPAAALADIKAIASSRRTTIVSYWVGRDRALAWVVGPDGTVVRERLAVTGGRLRHLVRRATSGLAGTARRGPEAVAEDGVEDAADAEEPGPPAAPGVAAPIVLRGGDRLVLDGDARGACRALYDVLLRPLRRHLPAAGGRLTIVPHGPLFHLSFAALEDEKGRYLIESYALHYTPSVGALRLAPRRGAPARRETLLVGDPALPAAVSARERLGPLPGARREVEDVLRSLGRRDATVVLGPDAREGRVRALLAGKSVVHFATHGVVRDGDALDAFLGLAGGGGSPEDDGRLTAAEIHRLSLSADLVFLSACRTASGRVGGDGVVGLTRAFLAAGAPSVVATLWDVSDDVAREVVRRFYPAWRRSGDRAAALREAQVAVLRALRRGELVVETPAGRLTLPEHPALWAPFVLQGVP
jgi:CHAT domain-containing protein/tetratricopeptide (TPR) repeat protein